MSGWIKLHRSIKDNWVFDNPEYLKAWLIILIEVNHAEAKVLIDKDLLDCKRGESLKSMGSWAKSFGKGWTARKVKTFFTLLEKDSMCVTQGLRKTTRLTVCNYDTYQSRGEADVTQDVTQAYNRSNTDVKEMSTNKNDKNKKNDKKYTIDSKPYGLLSASEQKERDSFLNASNYLYNAIVEHGKVTKVMKPESAEWLREFRLLKGESSNSWEEISNVLKLYCANMDDKYMPQAYSAKSFRAKYDKIREKFQKDKKQEETTEWKI